MLKFTRSLLITIILSGILSNTFSQNAIVIENAMTGSPASEWDVSMAGDLSIQGFATAISVNKGNPVSFKITTVAGISFGIKIYRLGYYQGNGARLVADLGNSFTGISQAPCITNTSTGQVDCGNWISQATWNVPATAVSGIYIAKLTRIDNGGSSHMIFIVRDDEGTSPMLFKTSDATWQAYNDYGGNNLYGGTVAGYPAGRAMKVSYNRPLINRQGVLPNRAIAGLTGLFNAEYAMVRWLERNGYDMSYTTCVDIASDTKAITKDGAGGTYARKILLSVGHDEYWSGGERQKFETARNAGVSLAFFSGNEVYWKTRWEPSIDGSGTPFRTLVCYKEGFDGEGICNRKCDPLSSIWTGLWRSGCEFPGTDACSPENALTGQISWVGSTGSITVPSEYKKYRIWKNTTIENLSAGQTATFPSGTLGHEWDAETFSYLSSYPARRITLSSTAVNANTHKLSLYKYVSGALVFGAGTVQWSWGLDEGHDRGSLPASPVMQQATINLLSDMGVQPSTLQPNLIAPSPSADATAPVVNISNPSNGATINGNSLHTISGTATDAGGEVGGVEVSVDNGVTWKPAIGTANWSFEWATPSSGAVNIKVRAFDDSWNIPAAGSEAVVTVNITAVPPVACPCTNLLGNTAPANTSAFTDGRPIVVGMRFRSNVDGYVSGARFFKASNNTGTHTGLLYSNTGTLLSQVTFTNETSSGWQEATFAKPFFIIAGTSYVIASHSSNGFYSATNNDFQTAKTNFPLIGLASGTDGINGVFRYSASPVFPLSGNVSTNYWVDVAFIAAQDAMAPVISNIVATPNTEGAAVITWNTSEYADSKIEYDTSASTLTQVASNGTFTLQHSVTLSGLQPLTTYFFRVSSKDYQGNLTVSPALPAAPLQFTMPTNSICAADNLASEFASGTTGANTMVVSNVNGEVALKQIFSEESFSGSALPTGWSAGTWTTGGTTSYNGGIAALNGTNIYTNTSFLPGSTIEFSARFTLGNFENIGFTANGNFDPYWAVVGRGNAVSLTNVYLRTSDGIQVSIGTDLLNAYHTYRLAWSTSGFAVYVDGILKATISKIISSPLIVIASDYNTDAITLSLDYFRSITGGDPSMGTFTSRVLSLGSNTGTATVSWNSTIPAATGLNISVRSGNTSIPDGTWNPFVNVSNNQSVTVAGSFVQYQAAFTSTNSSATPTLNDLSFYCTGTVQTQVPTVTLHPSNAVTCAGSSTSFTSAASSSPTPGVQWQSSSNGTTWSNITGATTPTLNITVSAADNGKQYRAAWTNSAGTAHSNTALLTVNPLPSGSLTGGTACYNQSATLTFTANAGTGPYSLVINGQTYNNVQSGIGFTTNITVPSIAPTTLWDNTVIPQTPAFTDKKSSMEMGTKFRTSVSGTVTALRFYKGSRTDNGIYKLRLYKHSTRSLLAEVSYQNSNFSGWVSVSLPNPVSLSAGELYVVSYFSPNRVYARANSVFASDLVRGPLIGVGTSTVYGPNGVYAEGGGFPTKSGTGKSYFAELVFNPSSGPAVNFNLTRITDAKGCVQTVNQAFSLSPANCVATNGKVLMNETQKVNPVFSTDDRFTLEQNKPNPFNNTTIISYTIPKQVHVTFTIYDLHGRVIKVIQQGQRNAGKYTLHVDSKDMKNGVYFYRLQAGEFSATKKMILR